MYKQAAHAMWISAMNLNKENIINLLKTINSSCDIFVDFGCDDGAWSVACGEVARAKNIIGVDIVETQLDKARQIGVHTILANLDGGIPLPDDMANIVHANQVIEHVGNVDKFAGEIFRLLKPGGHAVVSTENAASWCNIGSLVFGWQMFSLTNLSAVASSLGNPLALHRGAAGNPPSWTHKTIFSYRGLVEFFYVHGFVIRAVKGAGYFPFPSVLGLADTRHAHFLTCLIQKPK